MTLILRRLEQWSFGPDGPRWRRPRRASYTRLHSSLISRGRETMGGWGLVRDPPEERPPRTAAVPERPAGQSPSTMPLDTSVVPDAAVAKDSSVLRVIAGSGTDPLGQITRDDQRSYVKIESLLGRNATDIHDSLRMACGNDAVQRSTVRYWASVFRDADARDADDDRSTYGRQGSATMYSLRM